MSVRGVLIRIDSTDSLCDLAEAVPTPKTPKTPIMLKTDYFDVRGKLYT